MTTALIGILIGLASATLAWAFSLYYLVLHACRPARTDAAPSHAPAPRPAFHVIIPCYQEGTLLPGKLENTAQLKYPAERLQVTVIDGGSTDESADVARRFCDTHDSFTFLPSTMRGKVPQINAALTRAGDGIVLVTDADARLEADALQALALCYADPRVSCVGAHAQPAEPLPEDALFWRDQNAMRRLESAWGHASVTVACAYSFRHRLVAQLPPDVIADDVYVAFLCNTQGGRTLYADSARAQELRHASTLGRMIQHKVRKLNANMRELIRFLPSCRQMDGVWRVMFLTKFIQSWLAAPALLLLASLVPLSIRHAGWPAALIVWTVVLLLLLLSQFAAARILKRHASPHDTRAPVTLLARCRYAVLFAAILVLGFFRYFVVRQTSSYDKVH